MSKTTKEQRDEVRRLAEGCLRGESFTFKLSALGWTLHALLDDLEAAEAERDGWADCLLMIAEALGADPEATPPMFYSDWVARLRQQLADKEAVARAAAQIAEQREAEVARLRAEVVYLGRLKRTGPDYYDACVDDIRAETAEQIAVALEEEAQKDRAAAWPLTAQALDRAARIARRIGKGDPEEVTRG